MLVKSFFCFRTCTLATNENITYSETRETHILKGKYKINVFDKKCPRQSTKSVNSRYRGAIICSVRLAFALPRCAVAIFGRSIALCSSSSHVMLLCRVINYTHLQIPICR